jgi:electron transport complex protein RnfG
MDKTKNFRGGEEVMSILKPAIALLIIAGIAAALLGYVNVITTDPIAKADAAAKAESMQAVCTDASSFGETVEVEDENSEVTDYTPALDADNNVIGYAISVTTTGFSSGLKLMYGIDTEGTIIGLSVVDCSNETPGLGANAPNQDFGIIGQKGGDLAVTKDGGNVNAITGATITSRAVTNAANTAANFFNDVIVKGGVN